MKLTPINAKFIQLDWEDIVLDDGWDGEGTPVHVKECSTRGYLIVEHPAYVVLAGTYDWNDEVWGTMHAVSLAKPTIRNLKVTFEDEPQPETE